VAPAQTQAPKPHSAEVRKSRGRREKTESAPAGTHGRERTTGPVGPGPGPKRGPKISSEGPPGPPAGNGDPKGAMPRNPGCEPPGSVPCNPEQRKLNRRLSFAGSRRASELQPRGLLAFLQKVAWWPRRGGAPERSPRKGDRRASELRPSAGPSLSNSRGVGTSTLGFCDPPRRQRRHRKVRERILIWFSEGTFCIPGASELQPWVSEGTLCIPGASELLPWVSGTRRDARDVTAKCVSES